jgi:hypothetical protein
MAHNEVGKRNEGKLRDGAYLLSMDVRCTHWPLATGGTDAGTMAEAQGRTQEISVSGRRAHYCTSAQTNTLKNAVSAILRTFGAACIRPRLARQHVAASWDRI